MLVACPERLAGAVIVDPEIDAHETAALIPHALVDEVEGSGHFVWYERRTPSPPRFVASALDM